MGGRNVNSAETKNINSEVAAQTSSEPPTDEQAVDSKKSNTGVIVGGVIGLAVLAGLAMKGSKKKKEKKEPSIDGIAKKAIKKKVNTIKLT